MNQHFSDLYGRTISYVRLSVTDRCNFRCSYCAHSKNMRFIPHENILRYEEILLLLSGLVAKGVSKVRFTGGEPFTRKDFVSFLASVRKKHPDLNICVTTNGSLLEKHIEQLYDIGINSLNISLDSFDEALFSRLTGSHFYKAVRKGIDAALLANIPIKLNAVALKGTNDSELPVFLNFAQKNSIAVRFIEQMPLGGRGQKKNGSFWSAEEIFAKAQEHATLTPVEPYVRTDPIPTDIYRPAPESSAKVYRINNSRGTLGIIAPMSGHFCHACNRLRVTPEGTFRTCLFSDQETPFRHLLRQSEKGIETTLQLLESIVKEKPLGFTLAEARENDRSIITRSMSSIGG